MSQIGKIHTDFRSDIQRMSEMNRIQVYENPIDRKFEVAFLMKKLDGGKAILFPSVTDSEVPVIGNLLCRKIEDQDTLGFG